MRFTLLLSTVILHEYPYSCHCMPQIELLRYICMFMYTFNGYIILKEVVHTCAWCFSHFTLASIPGPTLVCSVSIWSIHCGWLSWLLILHTVIATTFTCPPPFHLLDQASTSNGETTLEWCWPMLDLVLCPHPPRKVEEGRHCRHCHQKFKLITSLL